VLNDPVNFIDPLGLINFPTPAEGEVLSAVGGGIVVCQEALEAQAELKDPNNGGALPSGNDSFRHCYASCVMTLAMGEDAAKTAGDLYEHMTPDRPPQDLQEDLCSNEAGIDSGNNASSPQDCRDQCLGYALK
jgi:hypothetical protein